MCKSNMKHITENLKRITTKSNTLLKSFFFPLPFLNLKSNIMFTVTISKQIKKHKQKVKVFPPPNLTS